MSGRSVPTVNMPRETSAVLAVGDLPDVVFGPRDLLWWGTLCFVLIEGFTLVLCAAVYVYLQQNFHAWPPEHTPRPSLVAPTIHVLLMLLSMPVVMWTSRRAHEYDLGAVRRGLFATAVFNAAFVGFRIWELTRSLNVRWDSNAYGSAQWLVLGAHGTLLVVEFIEVAGIALLFWVGTVERKHFSDAADAGFYWMFMTLAWIPLYVLCFWLPRWL